MANTIMSLADGITARGVLLDIPLERGVAHLDAYFRLVPYFYDAGYAKIDHFIRSEVKCEEAIISMQGGDRIRLSDDPVVAEFGFHTDSGITGFWRGDFCVWGVHNVTGQVYSMWQFPRAA